MSEEKNRRRRTQKQRIRLPDGTWGVYMGETGGLKKDAAPKKSDDSPRKNETGATPGHSDASARRGIISRYSLSEEERHEAERRKREIRAGRAAAGADRKNHLPARAPEQVKFYHRILDRFRMWRLGISVNIELIIKGVVCCALIIVFAMLQITVFSKVRPFGAIPDLMLPLVIAIGITEGERWGGVCGLAAAFLIECLGSVGITLLPLLYVPCGFIAGVLGTYYLRDSFVIRAIFTVVTGILRAVITVIYVLISSRAVSAAPMFKDIVMPEFISTAVFALIPHVVAWLSFKPFHKTRAERIN